MSKLLWRHAYFIGEKIKYFIIFINFYEIQKMLSARRLSMYGLKFREWTYTEQERIARDKHISLSANCKLQVAAQW